MSDIFISYARSTAAQARQVAEALRALGFGVWRDDDLPAHRGYAEVIEERLRSAKAVVVIWSAEAAKSQWVRAEADVAREAGTLVQLSLDGALPPLPFNQIQCAELMDWTGDVGAHGWRKVVASVVELVGAASRPAAVGTAAAAAPAGLPDAETYGLLLTDVDGASLLWLNHRAAMQEAVAAYCEVMRDAIVRHGGEMFKTDGELLFAAFRGPSDAVLAASEAQVALANQSWPGMGSLKPRMAIHVGAAERRGSDYFGPSLNRCTKLLALGHGGQVLATASAADLLRSKGANTAPFRSLGTHPLEDPLQGVGIHQVLVGGSPQDFPPLRLPEIHPHNLPRRQGALIGREAEMAQLARFLKQYDLVTITGTGGVGKTRIAIEVGHSQLGDYEDGVWLAELAPVADPEMVPGAIARAMNIELPPGQDQVTALVDRLRARECLIVLDNCEHVIDAVAGFAGALLEHSSKVKLLASSQELLGVEGERVFRLRSLGEPDAVTLFTERASAADANFVVRGRDAATIAAICQRLDGIPLAIEMAAARAPSLGCDGVLKRLDDRFRVLTGGRRTALPRQRTLQATLDWSHGLLSAGDAAVFRRIGVFTGGFTLEAASEVAADETIDTFEVVDGLSSLVAKSLVAADTDDNRTRYRLLETTRAYALEKLAAAGETETTQRRHAEYFVKFTTPARLDYYSVNDDTFAARYGPDFDNIERAMDWAFGPTGDAEIGIALTALSWTVWVFRSFVPEYIRWSDIAAARVTAATPERMRILLVRSQASANANMAPARTIKMVDEVLDALRPTGDPMLYGDPLLSKLSALQMSGRSHDARAVSAELTALTSNLPPSRLKVAAQFQAGLLAWAEKGDAAARPLHDAAVATAQAIGAEGWANMVLVLGTTSLIPDDNPDVAIDGLRNVLGRIRPTQMFSGSSAAGAASRLVGLLAVRGAKGDVVEAKSIARIHEKLAGRMLAFIYVLNLALVALKSGRAQDAARIAGFAEAQRAAAGVDFFRSRNAFEQAWTLIGAQLSAAELAALKAEGGRLSQDEAFRLAMGNE